VGRRSTSTGALCLSLDPRGRSKEAGIASIDVLESVLFSLGICSSGTRDEFSALEGIVNLPYWIMSGLGLRNGEKLRLRAVNLPKATYVKFVPHTAQFYALPEDPHALVLRALCSFTCLTRGSSITVVYEGKQFFLDIDQLFPTCTPCDAVTIVDADMDIVLGKAKDHERLAPCMAQQALARDLQILGDTMQSQILSAADWTEVRSPGSPITVEEFAEGKDVKKLKRSPSPSKAAATYSPGRDTKHLLALDSGSDMKIYS